MTEPDCFDLAIVGGSFAGLAAARTAAMRGLKVVVLEAKPDSGHRVATTGILVKEAAEEIDIPHDLTRRVHGVRLYAPNLEHIDLAAPGYYFLTTDTARLLRWMAAEAERAGAAIRYGTRFSGAVRQDGGFRFEGAPVFARYILGADGGRSAVARHFRLGQSTRYLTGLEIEYESLPLAAPLLHCFIDSRIAPGYIAWVSPGPCVTQVGLAVGHGRKPDLAAFQARTAGLFSYDRADAVERRAGRIPAGGLVSPWFADGVMLVGDAAGQVSPATGGGIKLAFQLGRRAAHAIADYMLALGPPPEVVMAAELPRFGLKRALRFGLDLAPPNALVNLAIGTWLMRRIAQQIYFHRRNPGGASWQDFEAGIARLSRLEQARAGESDVEE